MLLQAAALIDVKIKRLSDLLDIIQAKVYGPKQVGLLWVAPGVTLKAEYFCGGQDWGCAAELKRVVGVANVRDCFGIGTKTTFCWSEATAKAARELGKRFEASFSRDVPISSDMKKSLVSFLNISFPGVDAERLVFLLDEAVHEKRTQDSPALVVVAMNG